LLDFALVTGFETALQSIQNRRCSRPILRIVGEPPGFRCDLNGQGLNFRIDLPAEGVGARLDGGALQVVSPVAKVPIGIDPRQDVLIPDRSARHECPPAKSPTPVRVVARIWRQPEDDYADI